MAKRSQRRPVRYEKDQLGCMWGLISIFDFRHGRPSWKLISDRRHGSRHAVGTGHSRNKLEMLSNLDKKFQGTDGVVSTTATVTADDSKPSVKKLMEEEMFSEQDIKKVISNDEVETKQSDLSLTKADLKRTKKTRKKSRDIDPHNLNASENSSGCSCNHNPEQKSRSNFGVDEIVEEVCRQIHQKYINCVNHDLNGEASVKSNYKHSDIEEKLCLTIKAFMDQKFTDGKHLTEDQRIHFRELMNALDILSSDEQLFMKIVQDPNSMLAKYVQNLQAAQIEKDEESKSLAQPNLSEQKLGDLKQSEELSIRKQRYFFRRKIKPQRNPTMANENSEASKRIVILKPGPTGLRNSETERNLGSSPESHYIERNQGPSERVGSHFFLSEIKRKLKNAMGRQQHGVSTTGISTRFPYELRNLGDSDKGIGKEKVGSSPSKEHFYIERIAKPSSAIRKADRIGKMEESEMSLKNEDLVIRNQRVANIYIEAKKHLSEMLSNGDDAVDLSRRQFPKTLGRILSLSEYNLSPMGSPGRDLEHGFVTAQMRLSAYEKVRKANENTWSPKRETNASPLSHAAQNLESQSSVSENNPDYKVQPPNLVPSISDNPIRDIKIEETHLSIIDELSPEGDIAIVKETETAVQEEKIILDASSESSGSSIARDDQNGDMAEIFDDKRCLECSKEDSFEESPVQSSSLSSPSSSSTTKHVEDLKTATDIPERPSPVSVLEPLFTEDEISPGRTIFRPVELPIQPLQLQFEDQDSSATDQANNAKTCTEDKELMFDFVKAVMQASGSNWDDFCMKWLSSDQLIEPSLCEEVEFFPNQLCYDPKLLVDCINEVLVEVCGRYYGCFPWVSSVNPSIRPIPDMKTAIHEVWIGVYWHLLPLPLPRTLDQIVAKDMSRTGTWMDLRFDTETIGVDMSEAILQELMEDSILSFVGKSLKSEDALILVELE